MTIRSCCFAFTFKNQAFRLANNFSCLSQHSYSAIFATSSFIVKKFPEIYPPLSQESVAQIKAKTTQKYNPMYEFWNDYIVQCTVQKMSIRHQDTFFVSIPLEESLIQLLRKKSSLFTLIDIDQWKQLPNRQKVANIFSIFLEDSSKKIGIYLTQPLSKDAIYKPRLTKSAMYLGIFFNNQNWCVFDIPNGKYPEVEQLLTFDSIIITGSSWSVLNQSDFMVKATENLIQAYKQSNKLKIFGFCYGHQLISKYFGGEIVKKDSKNELQRIYFKKDVVQKHFFLQPLQKIGQYLYQTQYHQDFVQTLPLGFDLLADSESCKIQGLVSKDGRIFTTQFHSQILFNFVKLYSESLHNCGIQLGFKLKQQLSIIQRSIQDSVLMLKIIQAFIDL